MLGQATTFRTEVPREQAMQASAAVAAAGKCVAGGWWEWLNAIAGWGASIGLALLIGGIVAVLLNMHSGMKFAVIGALLLAGSVYALGAC